MRTTLHKEAYLIEMKKKNCLVAKSSTEPRKLLGKQLQYTGSSTFGKFLKLRAGANTDDEKVEFI